MIKCISYWSLKDGLTNTHPIGAALEDAGGAGFEGLELAIGPEGALTTGTGQGDCERRRLPILRDVDEEIDLR